MKRSFLYASLIALTFITSGYAITNFDKDLVVYFTFDNVKGKRIFDESGNRLDAAIVKDTKFVKGKYGNAVHITNDTEDCVNIPAADELEISEEITMMAWVYHEDWTQSSSQWLDKGCYSKRRGSYGMAVFSKNDFPELELRENHSGIAMITAGRDRQGRDWQGQNTIHHKMENRKWYHIAGTHNDENLKIYLDGEVISESDSRFGFAGTNDEDLRIGCAKGKPEYSFAGGAIDEVAIWSRALSETEIRAVMRGTLFAVSPKDKVATTWGNIKRRLLLDSRY